MGQWRGRGSLVEQLRGREHCEHPGAGSSHSVAGRQRPATAAKLGPGTRTVHKFMCAGSLVSL